MMYARNQVPPQFRSRCVLSHSLRAFGPLLMAVFLLSSFESALASTQAASGQWLQPIAPLTLHHDAADLRSHVEADKPFSITGPCGALIGRQDGSFEAWIFPVKLLSEMRIEARVDNYDVPINVNGLAAEIQVGFDHTTITYAHISFTVKETFFATRCAQQDGTGVMAIFQIDAVRPVTLAFSIKPEVQRMWPAATSGEVNPEWVSAGAGTATLNDTTRPGGSQAHYGPGWYMLHTDFPDLAGAIAIPGTEPGILPPYQEKPQTYPLQFILRYDPHRDAGKCFPLLMAISTDRASADKEALQAKLTNLVSHFADLYDATAKYYQQFTQDQTSIETPDDAFNRNFLRSEVAIDQMSVRLGDELGLVAGISSSGNSTRPGFGWFFGRDSLYTPWAFNSEGDFERTREALLFLMKRERSDGKMPHEFSQTAALVNWSQMPYEYAAADATPLFIMAMEDYWKSTGDTAFLRDHWNSVQRAWQFETSHDSDGIFDNSQGTGWVESWPQGMPHQEIYLAALDQQASRAMAALSHAIGQEILTQQAGARADRLAAEIPADYSEADGMYAFSRNPNGTRDATATVFPALAWWGGAFALPNPDTMFERWASDEFSTDWGARDVGDHEAVFDPMSYHQGSVWPLFTGWLSIAEYRTGRNLDGYAHLMQNANLTTEQDLGAVTELLSGSFFVPFGRSTSHQMWSSAMVVIPTLRGLFGIAPDAPENKLIVDPQLPAQWDHAVVRRIHVGDSVADLEFARTGQTLEVSLINIHDQKMPGLRIEPGPLAKNAGAKTTSDGREMQIPLPAVEVGLLTDAQTALPLPGASTSEMKIINQQGGPRTLKLTIEAQGGSRQELLLRRNVANLKVKIDGAQSDGDRLKILIPAGPGYQRQNVILSW